MPFKRELDKPGTLVRYSYLDEHGSKLDGISCGVDHEKTDAFKHVLIAFVVRWIRPGEVHPAMLQTRDLVLKAMEQF